MHGVRLSIATISIITLLAMMVHSINTIPASASVLTIAVSFLVCRPSNYVTDIERSSPWHPTNADAHESKVSLPVCSALPAFWKGALPVYDGCCALIDCSLTS